MNKEIDMTEEYLDFNKQIGIIVKQYLDVMMAWTQDWFNYSW